MMVESLGKVPNSPEYIEVVKTDIRDEGDTVLFEFQFARPVSRGRMDAFWDNEDSTIQKTIWDRFAEKGWKRTDPLIAAGSTSPDNKVWTFSYHKESPEDSSTVQ